MSFTLEYTQKRKNNIQSYEALSQSSLNKWELIAWFSWKSLYMWLQHCMVGKELEFWFHLFICEVQSPPLPETESHETQASLDITV